jgi:peptide/nickel transport system ATP-binding protein
VSGSSTGSTEVAGAARRPVSTEDDIVLRAEGLVVEYDGERPTRAVRGVSLDLRRGEVLGIAGESGCGKSTLAAALTRLLKPPARLIEGNVQFFKHAGAAPIDVMALEPEELRRFRWAEISMVFQSAMNALNPVTSLRKQFADIFRAHAPEMSADQRESRSRELLEMVGIDSDRIAGFPHELSGGMRQRVVIAMALALSPQVVIMDEPTTALDVVVQREILDEIERLQSELGFAVVFITHDLSLLLEVSDRLAVMYAGELIEQAPSELVGRSPAHPYTHGLLHSFPSLRGERRDLRGVPGSPPDLSKPVHGCAFTPRCPYAFEPCAELRPALRSPIQALGAPGGDLLADKAAWRVACHLHDPALGRGNLPSGMVGEPDETADPAGQHEPQPSQGTEVRR